MRQFDLAQLTVAHRERCEDRVLVVARDERAVLIVADGAGGIGCGDTAAEFVLGEVQSACAHVETADQWCAVLRQIDARITAGESTAVVVDVRPDRLFGASVGDSQAWIVHDGQITNLTIHQHRKPLLGSREARPMPFEASMLNGVLIVATDGFCNYVKHDRLARTVAQFDFFALPRQCIELVRLPSGELWDDIGIIVCRVRPPQRTRKRYTL